MIEETQNYMTPTFKEDFFEENLHRLLFFFYKWKNVKLQDMRLTSKRLLRYSLSYAWPHWTGWARP